MATPLPYSIHSIADAVASIDQGEDPWFAFGCFLHDWWHYAIDHRQDLIDTPPAPTTTAEGKRWAAFFAATVEELCTRTSFPCPAWTQKQDYELEHPWFHSLKLSQRDWLLSTTLEPFKRRNIFVGGSILDNKYELQQTLPSTPRRSIWSEQDLQKLAASEEVSSHPLSMRRAYLYICNAL
jgi:hypothetical protein